MTWLWAVLSTWKGQRGSFGTYIQFRCIVVQGIQPHPGSLAQNVWCCGLGLSDLSKSPLLHILQLVSPLEPKGGVEMRILKWKYTDAKCLKRFFGPSEGGPYLARSRGSIRFLFCRLLKRSVRTLPSGCRDTVLQTDDCSCRLMPNSHPNDNNPFTAINKKKR